MMLAVIWVPTVNNPQMQPTCVYVNICMCTYFHTRSPYYFQRSCPFDTPLMPTLIHLPKEHDIHLLRPIMKAYVTYVVSKLFFAFPALESILTWPVLSLGRADMQVMFRL